MGYSWSTDIEKSTVISASHIQEIHDVIDLIRAWEMNKDPDYKIIDSGNGFTWSDSGKTIIFKKQLLDNPLFQPDPIYGFQNDNYRNGVAPGWEINGAQRSASPQDLTIMAVPKTETNYASNYDNESVYTPEDDHIFHETTSQSVFIASSTVSSPSWSRFFSNPVFVVKDKTYLLDMFIRYPTGIDRIYLGSSIGENSSIYQDIIAPTNKKWYQVGEDWQYRVMALGEGDITQWKHVTAEFVAQKSGNVHLVFATQHTTLGLANQSYILDSVRLFEIERPASFSKGLNIGEGPGAQNIGQHNTGQGDCTIVEVEIAEDTPDAYGNDYSQYPVTDIGVLDDFNEINEIRTMIENLQDNNKCHKHCFSHCDSYTDLYTTNHSSYRVCSAGDLFSEE